MKLLRWWVTRADRGDVYNLPPWGYDEVVRSRWERGLLELRVKELPAAEEQLRRENEELRREVERLGGSPLLSLSPSPFGDDEVAEGQLALTDDAHEPVTDPWADAAAESMRSRFARSRRFSLEADEAEPESEEEDAAVDAPRAARA